MTIFRAFSRPSIKTSTLLAIAIGFGFTDAIIHHRITGQWMHFNAVIHSTASLASFFLGLFTLISINPNNAILSAIHKYTSSAFVWICLTTCIIIWTITGQSNTLMNPDSIVMLIQNGPSTFLHISQTSPLPLLIFAAYCWASFFLIISNSSRIQNSFKNTSTTKQLWLSIFLISLSITNAYALTRVKVHDSPLFTALGCTSPSPDDYMTQQFDPAACACTSRYDELQKWTNMGFHESQGKHNIIFILAESLRHDLITLGKGKFTFFQDFSKEGCYFPNSYATSSHSDYSDLSFWYSRYPLYAIHRIGYPPDAEWRGTSVFELLKRHNYTTAYYSSQNENWGGMISWIKNKGVDEFFHSEDYHGNTWENLDDENGVIALIKNGTATAGKIEDSKTLELSLSWIKKNRHKQFAIGINLQNTHYNYVIPNEGQEPFQPSNLSFKQIYAFWPQAESTNVKNRYLNAAFNMDKMLNKFKSELIKIGVWGDAVVVLIGDNGEAFYEHGYGNHSGPMYDEVARTFSAIKYPLGDAHNGTTRNDAVSHIDFVPMAVQALGIPAFPAFQGTAKREKMPIFMHVNAITREYGIMKHPWKLIRRSFPSASKELFNLNNDPKEIHNIASMEDSITKALATELNLWIRCQLSYYANSSVYKNYYIK